MLKQQNPPHSVRRALFEVWVSSGRSARFRDRYVSTRVRFLRRCWSNSFGQNR